MNLAYLKEIIKKCESFIQDNYKVSRDKDILLLAEVSALYRMLNEIDNKLCKHLWTYEVGKLGPDPDQLCDKGCGERWGDWDDSGEAIPAEPPSLLKQFSDILDKGEENEQRTRS